MELDSLLGLQLDRGIEMINGLQLEYSIVETVSPKRDESLGEKRIVRAKKSDKRIYLTIGYF